MHVFRLVDVQAAAAWIALMEGLKAMALDQVLGGSEDVLRRRPQFSALNRGRAIAVAVVAVPRLPIFIELNGAVACFFIERVQLTAVAAKLKPCVAADAIVFLKPVLVGHVVRNKVQRAQSLSVFKAYQNHLPIKMPVRIVF